jgi:hypothetical protein
LSWYSCLYMWFLFSFINIKEILSIFIHEYSASVFVILNTLLLNTIHFGLSWLKIDYYSPYQTISRFEKKKKLYQIISRFIIPMKHFMLFEGIQCLGFSLIIVRVYIQLS